jgi:hypothetical protein
MLRYFLIKAFGIAVLFFPEESAPYLYLGAQFSA